MTEPIYTAKTWADANGAWKWRTLRDGVAIARPPTVLSLFRSATSREAAIEQARLDMEWDQTKGPEEVVLNPEALPHDQEPQEDDEVPRGVFTRTRGLYVVMVTPPGPASEFVELEDEYGRGVGPEESGAEWKQEWPYWTLGPFAKVDNKPCVMIYPREGIDVERIKEWLESNFQIPGDHDGGNNTRTVEDNPLINARIEVQE